MDEHWDFIQNFQSMEKTPENVIYLEWAMNNILEHLSSNKHHLKAGYSESFPRYLESKKDLTNKNIYNQLRQHYFAREKQLVKLRQLIEEREDAIQNNCQHIWELDTCARDHKNYYKCATCKRYR